MSLMAKFTDGQLVTSTASSNSLKSAKEENSSGIDSEAFLNLLVAEMQNQDPLEPTSNTEWISQYATFTQVSEIQNIGDDMASMKAQDLVGKDVIMKVTNDKGNTDFVSGKVDYVVYEEGDAFLSINDTLYSIHDLDTVASSEYMEAYNLASQIVEDLKRLPNVEDVTAGHKDAIESIYDRTTGMNSYQQTFLQQSVRDKVDEYYKKLLTVLGTGSEEQEG